MSTQFNKFDATFTFNSSGSFNSKDGIKIHFDKEGNLLNDKKRVFGRYNFPIDIQKLIYINIFYIGLGDIVDFFTKKLYIKNLIMYLTNGNCGCEKRRILFNKIIKFPYKLQIKSRQLYFDDYETIEEIKNTKTKITTKKTFHDSFLEQFNVSTTEYDKYFKTQEKEFKKSIEDAKSMFKNNSNNNENNNVSKQPQKAKPVNYKEIKGGCGCNKNKK
jgi:hypothetical protein